MRRYGNFRSCVVTGTSVYASLRELPFMRRYGNFRVCVVTGTTVYASLRELPFMLRHGNFRLCAAMRPSVHAPLYAVCLVNLTHGPEIHSWRFLCNGG